MFATCVGNVYGRPLLSPTLTNMATLPKYMQQRRQGFYAVLDIPKVLRPVFNMKPRFMQSLGTRDLKIAERRLPLLITRWKDQIEKARGTQSPSTGILWEVGEWRRTIQEAAEGASKEAAQEQAYAWIEGLAERSGVAAAQEAVGVIFHDIQPLRDHIDGWFATIQHLDPKTQSLQKLAVSDLCGYFKTNAKITKDSVKEYLLFLRTERNLSDKTITIRLSSMRSFVRYMDAAFGTDHLPLFTIKALARTAAAKTAKQRAWVPFTAEEVSTLYQAALSKKKPDTALADLIAFGAYTGCRIEELAQLRVEHFTESSFRVEDSKTAAGIREVPLHPALSGRVQRLKDASEDGYLLAGSNEGSFDKRSDALGKRFGNLKKSSGFGPQHVFHSIRKTVVSQLEQAGVNENITADIVGHDKPRITYGLYSSGASLKQKAKAIARVTYAGSLGKP
jgi:integrase